ncbi:hypothetical protein [Microcystis sp.]
MAKDIFSIPLFSIYLVIAIAEGTASQGALLNLTGWFWRFGESSDRLLL